MQPLSLTLALAFLAGPSLAGNYLFWMPLGSRSMKIGIMDMVYELAARGHTVTVVSAHGAKRETPGVREIVIQSGFESLVQEAMREILVTVGAEPPWTAIMEQSLKDNRAALDSQELRQLVAAADVDVVCVVPFGNEAGFYLSQKMNASLALLWTGPSTLAHINWAVGDPYNPATSPMPLTGYSHPMTFSQRIVNTLVIGMLNVVNEFYLRPKTHSLLVEVFPEDKDIPSISSLSKTAALLITHGSPFLADGMKPSMPQSVQAALMSCGPTDPLPAELRTFMDDAEHGVIFISFGSVIKPSMMPESKRLIFVSVFGRLKQRVIWKWDTAMPDAPANVLVSSWLPQKSLLAHPSLKLFISHAGAGSLQETICYTTPIVAVPINSDQFVNANEAVRLGIGVKVDWHSLSEDSLDAALTEVLTEPSYQTAVEQLQSRILDTPQHPLERAVWWLEFLLRQPPGNPAMRSPGHDLHWSQLLLLDVCLAIFLGLLATIYVSYTILSCFCACFQRKQKKE